MESDNDAHFIPMLFGLPSGVGYDRDPNGCDASVHAADDIDGATRLIRVLTLKAQARPPGRAPLLSEGDLAKLLKSIIRSAGDPGCKELITSCDSSNAADSCQVDITLTLKCAGPSPGSDRRIAKGIAGLFAPLLELGDNAICFTTAAGINLSAVDYAGGSRLRGALLCRVITRAAHESVAAAFISRGVPEIDILQVSAKPVGDTGVPTNTVLIRLSPGFPVSRVPWKIPLQEPGESLGPRKVSIQGFKGCSCCRDTGHTKTGCKSYKEELCGRCTMPFHALTQQGRNPLNHDCEGGPGGFGAAHLDPMGDGWHHTWKVFELARLNSIPMSEDPVTNRASDLQAARDLADIVRAQLSQAGKKKKKGKRKQPYSPAPEEEDNPSAAVRRPEMAEM
jgi:hypothetical protein